MTCPAPDCDSKATQEYDGPHGNSILLCPEHYYHAVTGGRTVSYVRRDDGGSARGCCSG